MKSPEVVELITKAWLKAAENQQLSIEHDCLWVKINDDRRLYAAVYVDFGCGFPCKTHITIIEEFVPEPGRFHAPEDEQARQPLPPAGVRDVRALRRPPARFPPLRD